MAKERTKYDIFISYRRVGGAQYARILQLMLQQRGYKVFLDYDELTDGVFGDHIMAAIKDAPIFMLVLSQNSMERCVNENDWVRQEILLALQENKHIIPINPDNKFDGLPDGLPDEIKNYVSSHQHSEIGFGQTLGVTIDLMVNNRIVPTLGERLSSKHVDDNFDAATETLRKIDRHQRFMKRLGLASAIAVVLIILATCIMFWTHHKEREQIADARFEIEKRYSAMGIYLNDDNNLSLRQLNAIDTLLQNMVPVINDSLWVSKYEFTEGLWHDLQDEDCDESLRNRPVVGKTYGDISFFILDLNDIIKFDYGSFSLPSVEQWQYAAHGGNHHETTTYSGDNDIDKVAWYKDNSGGKVHDSDGQQNKYPNRLDLFDMSGNVSELCNTPFDNRGGDRYCICGGNYMSPPEGVSVGSVASFNINAAADTVGFRLVISRTN